MSRSRSVWPLFALFVCAMLLVIRHNYQRQIQVEQFAHLLDQGNVEGVRRLLAAGANPNSRDWTQRSMLRQTVSFINASNSRQRVEIALLLLKAGANPNSDEDTLRQTLDLRSSDKAAHELVPALLAHGARLKAEDLCEAVYYGDASIVNAVLDLGADPNKVGMQGSTPLQQACAKATGKDRAARYPVVKLLLERGAAPNDPAEAQMNGDVGESVLNQTARQGNAELVELLLAHGAAVNWKDRAGNTVLMSAVNSKTPAVVDLLLRRGADMRAKNRQGRTALQFAIELAAGKAPWTYPNAPETRPPSQIAGDKQAGRKIAQILRQAGATQ